MEIALPRNPAGVGPPAGSGSAPRPTAARLANRSTRRHPAGLARRQVDVLELVAQGRTNAQVAEALHLSPKTVDHHVSAVLGKLGASSRTEAAVISERLGST